MYRKSVGRNKCSIKVAYAFVEVESVGEDECGHQCGGERECAFVKVEAVGVVPTCEMCADDEVVGTSSVCLYALGKDGEVFACAE